MTVLKKNFYLAGNVKSAAVEIEIADTFFSRFCGLMGRKHLPEGHGLLLAPCSSVHMCFMRFSIDVVYLDKGFRILKIVRKLRPWLGLSMCPGAWGVVELAAGEAERLGMERGQILTEVLN